MILCGAEKCISGREEPLICNLPAGHGGDHGICAQHGLRPYVTWTA